MKLRELLSLPEVSVNRAGQDTLQNTAPVLPNYHKSPTSFFHTVCKHEDRTSVEADQQQSLLR